MRNLQFAGIGFFLLTTAMLAAQQLSSNPFDLYHRLPERMRAATAVVYTPMVNVSDSISNPFNVVPHRIPGVARGISESIELTFQPLNVLPRGDALSDSFLFWILLALLGFLSFAIASKRSIVVKAWRGFLNDNALSIAQKEASGFTGSTPYYLLYVSFLLNAGAFIFLIARYFNQATFNNLGFLLICMLLSFVLFLSKHLLLGIIQWLYPVGKSVRRYNFLIIIFNCVLGLFLVPFNFLVAFAREYAAFMVYWTLALAGIFYLYRTVRAISIGQKFLSRNLFHFLLYLCTVEIAPVVILIKLAIMASG